MADPQATHAHEQHDDLPAEEQQHRNPYSSANRWRHQESSKFARHAAAAHAQGSAPQPREPENHSNSADLAAFLNKTRITPAEGAEAGGSSPKDPETKFTPIVVGAAEARKEAGTADHPDVFTSQPEPKGDGKEVACGPLLNYRRMEAGRWLGSVLLVTRGGGKVQQHTPTLVIRKLGPRVAAPNGVVPAGTEVEAAAKGPSQPDDVTDAETAEGSKPEAANNTAPAQTTVAESTHDAPAQQEGSPVTGYCLYSDPRNTFWRFDIDVPVESEEMRWEYTLPGLHFISKTKPRRSIFHVPAASESMRIMFHSCNGFSVGTDEEAWSGPALWNDVLRVHEERPFHVMIGGGDQIYNDGIRVDGPLRKWTDIGNPKKRRDHPYPESLRQECDDYYLKNYIRWYSIFPFANANGQIAQLNIWDDHDIIDGFGSYTDHFMQCDVFRGIGGTAHKYYLLFQHHLPPPASTYTSDVAAVERAPEGGVQDPNQLMDTYVAPRMTESQYIVGNKPGPYVAEHSHNMYSRLGARMAFVGIDARTERTRHQVNYPETYDLIFSRLREELSAAKQQGQPIRHLIVLLGIPIAYPRLTWLENVFSSPFLGPLKLLNRRFGFGGGFFNHFDGSVDLLDDLDDHYTARTHKRERNSLIERLQGVCAEHSVRATILGGDVHLAAFGRFYSNPKLGIPIENDHRYIPNVISSAIVNKPPPAAVANLLARRNKIHHLNRDTDETLLKLFDKDPGESSKTAGHNNVTMPSRNFAIITENSANNGSHQQAAGSGATHLAPPGAANGTNGTNASAANGNTSNTHLAPPGSSAGASAITSAASSVRSQVPGKDGHYPISAGETGCGTTHRAATAKHGTATDGSLDVCIRVEIDNSDKKGTTQSYGLSIPVLDFDAAQPAHRRTLAEAAKAAVSAGHTDTAADGKQKTEKGALAGQINGNGQAADGAAAAGSAPVAAVNGHKTQ
ncbi:hypothetical protein ACKVWC_003738 [Pyricularia oryzae]